MKISKKDCIFLQLPVSEETDSFRNGHAKRKEEEKKAYLHSRLATSKNYFR